MTSRQNSITEQDELNTLVDYENKTHQKKLKLSNTVYALFAKIKKMHSDQVSQPIVDFSHLEISLENILHFICRHGKQAEMLHLKLLLEKYLAEEEALKEAKLTQSRQGEHACLYFPFYTARRKRLEAKMREITKLIFEPLFDTQRLCHPFSFTLANKLDLERKRKLPRLSPT